MPPEGPEGDDRAGPWGPRDGDEGETGAHDPARRVLPSQSDSAPAAEQFNCPNCGGTIEIKAAGYTVTVACQYCGSVLDVADPDVKIIKRYEEEVRALELPLGSRGKLRGHEWEVIGYLRRSENGQYPWDEYLLFNPYRGYRYLDTDGRGWSFGKQLAAQPSGRKHGVLTVDGEDYEPFYRDTAAQVDRVVGEFYWRVQAGDEARTADYVRPGKMLSWEYDGKETVWTLSELLEPHEITDAFGIDPPKGGGLPLPHQPSPYKEKSSAMWKLALLAAAALVVMSFVFGGTRDPQTAVIDLATNGAEREATIGPVVLDRPSQAVTVSASAPGIENSWVDLAYTLTNRETGDVYQAANVVERYSGRDAEGNWSEGSRSSSSKFSRVPRGTYDLTAYAAGSQWRGTPYASSNSARVEITIAKGATFFSNLFLALLLVLAPALWMWIRHLGFETRRKSDSDFADDDD